VVARKADNKWYVAGINGENVEKELSLDLSFLKGKECQLITSGSAEGDEPSFESKQIAIPESGILNVTLKGNDGFVAVFE
jgi:hypothetical protein